MCQNDAFPWKEENRTMVKYESLVSSTLGLLAERQLNHCHESYENLFPSQIVGPEFDWNAKLIELPLLSVNWRNRISRPFSAAPCDCIVEDRTFCAAFIWFHEWPLPTIRCMVIETNPSVQVAGMILLTNRLYADLMRTLQIYDEIFQRYSNISQLRCLELALRFVFFSIDENTAYPYFF